MAFPSPPWQLRGDAWGSLFRAAAPGEATGTWAVALVRYTDQGTLPYSELAVARVEDPLRGIVRVRDMWVDSPTSRDAGRALWALPKELAVFEREGGGLPPVGRHRWAVTYDGNDAVHAEFVDAAALSVRTPLHGATRQVRDDGTPVRARLRGSARVTPCLARWDVVADGPLGWLSGRAPLVSFRARDFRLTFG